MSADRYYPQDGVPTAPVPHRPDLGPTERLLTREQRQLERERRLSRFAPAFAPQSHALTPERGWWWHRFDEVAPAGALYRALGARLDALYPESALDERTATLARLVDTFLEESPDA